MHTHSRESQSETYYLVSSAYINNETYGIFCGRSFIINSINNNPRDRGILILLYSNVKFIIINRLNVSTI